MVEDVMRFILTLCVLQVRKYRTQLYKRDEGFPSAASLDTIFCHMMVLVTEPKSRNNNLESLFSR